MADLGEDEEYESDPEQAKLSLKMRRRREASDDEEDDDGDDDGGVSVRVRARESVINSRVSDCESDGQGAAAEYDDDEYDLVEEEEELLEEVEDECEVVHGVIEGSSVGIKRENDQTDGDEFYVPENADQFYDNANGKVGEGVVEEKKENEPFQVPTAGAFYMHDDRFRDSAGGRHRRGLGRGKLWELRDDRKWGHDKFEEMSMHERHYDEGRRVPRGRNRARGRNQGEDRGFARGNRLKTYNNNNNNNNQINASKSVRGRGPKRYQQSTQNNFENPAQSRQATKPMEKNSYPSSGRASAASATSASSESGQVLVRKNVVASSLNSASPPFYPSGTSNKETNKKDNISQTGSVRKMGENNPISQSNNIRGRNVSDSLSMDKLYIDDSGKPLNNVQAKGEGRGPMAFGQVAYQPVPVPHQHNQVNRVPNQQFVPRSASGSRASSPPKTSGPTHAIESADLESSTESNDSKTAIVGKGKSSIATSGMSSFSYGNHGDPNFPGAPTFLPVMQFAGQHPGGLGVPAVGMAFPGYVGQPNGMGNSEMTWLPVLAGAAGALGGNYPYITMDGAYHSRPAGQPSALSPLTSKDSNINKPGSEVKPSQRPELANDDLRQRQNKARRYTEMKFDK